MKLLDRFLKYVSFDTRSDPRSGTSPSTESQRDLMRYLSAEMEAIGLTDVKLDANGYLTATLGASADCETAPVIGFIAHADTSPDMTAANVKPQIIRNYDGSDIPLGDEAVMKVSDFPELRLVKGHTLVTTDGTTLLGADDKCGIAEIMAAMEHLAAHPEIPHGKIRIAITPDEEIGRGTDGFDVEGFGARYAYTVDGGIEGELEYENFNAADAIVDIRGRNIHPGYAKDRMINAISVAREFDSMLPARERPEYTEGYEGFLHLNEIAGTVERAHMEYLVRDHSREKFEQRKEFMRGVAHRLNERYGAGTVDLTLKDSYYNMREMVEPHPEVIGKAIEAMRRAGVEPVIRPIRGGTDGARLSYMGLPCPNLFTGGMNFHGRYEYCSLDSMHKAVETIVNICRLWAS